jgi:hypothetical protein
VESVLGPGTSHMGVAPSGLYSPASQVIRGGPQPAARTRRSSPSRTRGDQAPTATTTPATMAGASDTLTTLRAFLATAMAHPEHATTGARTTAIRRPLITDRPTLKPVRTAPRTAGARELASARRRAEAHNSGVLRIGAPRRRRWLRRWIRAKDQAGSRTTDRGVRRSLSDQPRLRLGLTLMAVTALRRTARALMQAR